MLQNRWHNAHNLGIQVISSHIFREGNSCANKLAALDHSIFGEIWLDILPDEVKIDFYRGRYGLPNYRFSSSIYGLFFCFFCFMLFFGGFWYSPPTFCKYLFPLFLINFSSLAA
jgi:hypothetical protein